MNQQPEYLMQFIGAVDSCNAAEATVTFKLTEMPPSQAERLQRFADKLAKAGTKILVLTYEFDGFNDWHNAVMVPLLKAQVENKKLSE